MLSFAVSKIIPQLAVLLQRFLHSFISATEIPFPLKPASIKRSFSNHNRFILVEENNGYNCTNPINTPSSSFAATNISESLFFNLSLINMPAPIISPAFRKIYGKHQTTHQDFPDPLIWPFLLTFPWFTIFLQIDRTKPVTIFQNLSQTNDLAFALITAFKFHLST